MLVVLTEYAKMHNRSGDTVRRLAENGMLKRERNDFGRMRSFLLCAQCSEGSAGFD